MKKENVVLFTIFGATGDLAKRKLYPSLFRLFRKGLLNEHFAVIGTARREWSNEHYREIIRETIQDLDPVTEEASSFISHFYYQAHNVTDTEHYDALKNLADTLDEKYQLQGNRLYYLAMAPQFFGTIVAHLESQKIKTDNGFNRLIIEKPFGFDYPSAHQLNKEIRAVFPEEDIFRIDHYLGKEMIQNISAIRFANNIFESQWNNRYIDNIQITFAEALGVEDRGGYYDQSGALKDMVQNHILQVLALLAMEPPVAFSDREIRHEKVKALNAVRIYSEEAALQNFVRGQYAAGSLDCNDYTDYRSEPNVPVDSTTETFVAGKLYIDNFRWSGVPFYFRTGKRLTEKGTRINIVFKQVPINVFRPEVEEHSLQEDLPPNVLTIYIQPTEGFSMTLNGKEVGQGFNTLPVKLDYRNSAETVSNSPEAYEKLMLDALLGDSTNFTHWDELKQSWKIVDVVRAAWDKQTPDFPNYPAGTMGPQAAFDLLEKDGFQWIWQPDIWYRERNKL
ncbi:glucose-6-phosphate 1-dehydrogenase [Enterococcus sp. PF1-24]|uniref:glucose-6-phosphate dehydrogenase n=1 Tax=unclassified Enterococcus TaxID=2608891 RepID=UPI002476C88F|nr:MULTISPECIES: glucose-6-phosphate dehydrogenase [unclassified Enterococcus]MDH6364454.1 glucose-6-phosphate 1-dehydrogenase [Enterococcus sp. PFB1-1]MDH6401523.1 glucose-6-phosphate 1-dehydrogenase [Enterococcus sp. PF1-24]